MIDAEQKLKTLQACIGEKKLKQLGLIPCTTCREILIQVMNISLPNDLKNKAFLTSEEMSTISQTILLATNGYLNNVPQENPSDLTVDLTSISNIPHKSDRTMDMPFNIEVNSTLESHPSTSSPSIEDTGCNISSDLVSTTISTEVDGGEATELVDENTTETSTSEISPEFINALNNEPIKSEQELVSKLLTILNQSHHITQDDLGMGYIYTPPTTAPFPHTLSCSECGHLYAITTHPSLKLIPLPVYLSDVEYEMIKGVYVDILL